MPYANNSLKLQLKYLNVEKESNKMHEKKEGKKKYLIGNNQNITLARCYVLSLILIFFNNNNNIIVSYKNNKGSF